MFLPEVDAVLDFQRQLLHIHFGRSKASVNEKRSPAFGAVAGLAENVGLLLDGIRVAELDGPHVFGAAGHGRDYFLYRPGLARKLRYEVLLLVVNDCGDGNERR